MSTRIIHGNSLNELPYLEDCSVDAIITDPPYELGFMNKKWDSSGIAYNINIWAHCLRVLKPGGHLLAFGGTRTYHRMACAIEDAGFEVRDSINWIYGSGFPKSLDVSKAIDKAAGAEREIIGERKLGGNAAQSTQEKGGTYASNTNSVGVEPISVPITTPSTDAAKQWEGWGTALKPAHEPIVLARKPFEDTVANNVMQHGTGALNIDGCRVETTDSFGGGTKGTSGFAAGYEHDGWVAGSSLGRWPANVIHDGSDEVVGLFPSSKAGKPRPDRGTGGIWSESMGIPCGPQYGDDGSAARFFYCAKAGKSERNAGLPKDTNIHPTVKPLELMKYLCRLITPPNGIILDPFAGSGSTLVAATLEGFNSIGIEMTADYLPIIEARIKWAESQIAP
jgi:site-specific DNA-methyltransferase (adenine-specific)